MTLTLSLTNTLTNNERTKMITQEGKAELIKRATEHAAADRLIQSFGYFERMGEDQAANYNLPGNNGEKTDWKEGDWAGCAIGCLATPVLTQEEYRRMWLEGEFYGQTYERSQRTLDQEFGVPPTLTSMAETVFENLPKEDAKRWPEQFARALPVEVEQLTEYRCQEFRIHNPEFTDLREAANRYVGVAEIEPLARKARDEILAWLNGDREEAVA